MNDFKWTGRSRHGRAGHDLPLRKTFLTLFCYLFFNIQNHKNMHRERKRNRLQGFDYSREALYFVTICVHDRICCLGHIEDKTMYPNELGQIVSNQWDWLAEQYPYVRLHEFVVMPNHIHGILEINQTDMDKSVKIKSLSELIGAYKTTASKAIHELQIDACEARYDLADIYGLVRIVGTNPPRAVIPDSLPIPVLTAEQAEDPENIRFLKLCQMPSYGLKGAFEWQRSYHDHIIRDERGYHNIANYIINNPANWKEDKFHQ
ncbi:MAG: hypothetical protein RIS64_703 [Bacteroidota bacterium]